MDALEMTRNPLAVLTLIAAPAVLTNATSTLANSTINRMLHTRDRMHELFAESASRNLPAIEAANVLRQVDRVERQAVLLRQRGSQRAAGTTGAVTTGQAG